MRVEGLTRLSGGASRETWSFDAVGAPGARHHLVLRRDPPGRPSVPGQMRLEATAIRAAAAAGLAVPEVVADSEDPETWGSAGVVMRRVDGETVARRILRDDEYAGARRVLTEQMGRFLAGLHAIDPDSVDGLADLDSLGSMRDRLAGFDEPSPTFEFALRWLGDGPPSRASAPAVIHGDFRLGNLIVGPDGLRAVLDWELVHRGDPLEDLGWLCVKAWRFGSAPPVAGVGTREELIAAYEAAGGAPVDPDALRWWEVLNTLKWGLGCMGQARVHLNGMVRSVELATIGRRTCEQEWDLLLLLAPGAVAAHGRPVTIDPPAAATADDPGLHGRPTATELLDAVREFLADEVMTDTADRRRAFHARVAANAIAMVERELTRGAPGERRRADVARLGVRTEGELADAIRRGDYDSRRDDLVEVLVRGVAEKLAVANPRYLAAPVATS